MPPAKDPKKGVGFANVYSMNTQPPPPPPVRQSGRETAKDPRDDRPSVPPPPPGPNQGGLPTEPSNSGGPTLAPPPFSGPSLLQNSGIFGGTGIRPTAIDEIYAQDEKEKRPEDTTPSKRNEQNFSELQNLVETPTLDDEQLLKAFTERANQVRAGKTVEELKNELRASVQPWINAGIRYEGLKRPGLYLPDGTRNPARPARGVAGDPSSVTIPASPEKRPADPGKGSKATKAPQPTSKGNKSSTGTGKKSSTGTGTSSSTGTKEPPPPPADKGVQPLATTGTGLLSGNKKSSSSGIKKGSSKDKQPSPLSQPPTRPEDVEDVINDTPPATDRAGWPRRDDLFEAHVMDEAGVKFFVGGEKFNALPTLESTIDYNTENWE